MRKTLAVLALITAGCTPRVKVPATEAASSCLRDCQRVRNDCSESHRYFVFLLCGWVHSEANCDDRYQDCALSCWTLESAATESKLRPQIPDPRPRSFDDLPPPHEPRVDPTAPPPSR